MTGLLGSPVVPSMLQKWRWKGRRRLRGQSMDIAVQVNDAREPRATRS